MNTNTQAVTVYIVSHGSCRLMNAVLDFEEHSCTSNMMAKWWATKYASGDGLCNFFRSNYRCCWTWRKRMSWEWVLSWVSFIVRRRFIDFYWAVTSIFERYKLFWKLERMKKMFIDLERFWRMEYLCLMRKASIEISRTVCLAVLSFVSTCVTDFNAFSSSLAVKSRKDQFWTLPHRLLFFIIDSFLF